MGVGRSVAKSAQSLPKRCTNLLTLDLAPSATRVCTTHMQSMPQRQSSANLTIPMTLSDCWSILDGGLIDYWWRDSNQRRTGYALLVSIGTIISFFLPVRSLTSRILRLNLTRKIFLLTARYSSFDMVMK